MVLASNAAMGMAYLISAMAPSIGIALAMGPLLVMPSTSWLGELDDLGFGSVLRDVLSTVFAGACRVVRGVSR